MPDHRRVSEPVRGKYVLAPHQLSSVDRWMLESMLDIGLLWVPLVKLGLSQVPFVCWVVMEWW